MNYFFSEEELAFNASLDAWDLLIKMGFNEGTLYREGTTIRLFCPLHKDQIRRSMIIYTDRNTYKCQYTNCEGHKGGNLLEFYSAYMGVDLPEVVSRIRNQGTTETDLVERADKMIQEGNLVDALPLLQKAVQVDPSNEITRCRLAALYLELGDKEAGYQEYMTAAEHFGVRGDLDKTLNIYNILVIISPDDVKVRKQLSYLFSRLKREDEAVHQLKWVVDKHVRKGELTEGVAMCKKMIELCPEYPESHRILGEIYLKQGDYFNAVEELRAAATHFIRQNNLKKAKDTVELGLRYTPGNPAMKELRGKIEKAIELQKASKEQPDVAEKEYEDWIRSLKESVGLPEEAEAAAAATGATASASGSPAAPASAPAKSGAAGGGPVFGAPVTRPGAVTAPAARQTSSGAPLRAPIPQIDSNDPRIDLCKRNLSSYTPDQLESLHQHLVSMFNEVTSGLEQGFMSEFEANTVREFYAAFSLALESFKSESGRYRAASA